MILKEKYTKNAKLNKLSGAILFFADEKFEISNINNFLSISQKELFKKNQKKNSKKKNIFTFDLNHDQKIIVFSVKKKNNSYEKNGAQIYEFLKNENLFNLHIFAETIQSVNKSNSLHELVHGMKLKSYSFDKYKSKKNSMTLNINLIYQKKVDKKLVNRFNAIESGINFTQDVVSEPGNV